MADFTEEFGGLAQGWSDEDGFGFWGVDGVVEGADGGGGGLAPLAAAVDEAAGVGGVQDFGLEGIGGEFEAIGGPEGGRRWNVSLLGGAFASHEFSGRGL